MNHARNARFRGPSARIARKAYRSRSCAVIRAVAGDDLVTAGEEARQLDGILVGLSAAVGEEEGVDVAGSDFGKLRAQPRADFRSHEGIRIGKRGRLVADRLNDALIAVSNVDGHELAVEIDEALPFRRVKVDPLGASNRNRIDLRLRGPLIKRVLAGERDDFGAGHSRRG